ncbi:inorganic phosphate transporter [Miltoncostaea oceani]|uniref:inorganic phosphate transporter n=1 Tax=Miltoncostaea oceani TaxID=2843216 RepID=UPI001C3CBFCD|nr:inorganic phosphate transporter [Miltoncostaea oceani]
MSAETAVVVAITLVWAVSGGIHDAGTLTASGIASRALSPRAAILLVGVFGFAGPLVVGTAVATTIGSFVDLGDLPPEAALRTIAAGLAAAITWNVVTWRLGIPASSTHGLVGGLVGATVVVAGPDDVVWGLAALAEGRVEGVTKVLAALVLSPLVGLALGAVVLRTTAWALSSGSVAWNRRLRRAQVPAVAALSFAHGANEAQKGMGIIALALLAGGAADELAVPAWAVVLSASTIPLGAVVGGWRIVRTLGFGIYRLRPMHAAGAQATAALVVAATSAWGGPVSTSQVASSAIIGVGAAERPRSVRWETGKSILAAWVLTIPATAALAALLAGLLRTSGAMG